MPKKLSILRQKLQEIELNALLISDPSNRRYVSGFTGSSGNLLVSKDRAVLATDFRYVEQARIQSPSFQIINVNPGWNWLITEIGHMKAGTIGFESKHMTFAIYKQITNAIKAAGVDVNFIATDNLVEMLRAVKDPDELAFLQQAIDISDGAMESVVPTIKPGQTEMEVAWQLEIAMRGLGADSISFDTIVASGPNGAMPHHRPSQRPIQTGEPVVIDMGAKLNGYCSDITRTIYLGEPDDTFCQIYDLVLGAQLAAIATLKPKMSGGDGDGLARNILDRAGYDKNFGHSLGHGIGLDVHEYPWVGPKSTNTLEEGMVFSVEPGIYLTGWGGVRIEDLVILETNGARPLSKAQK